jgi:hypothetical protein
METIGTRSSTGGVQYCLVKDLAVMRDDTGLPRVSPWIEPLADFSSDIPGARWFPVEDRDTQPFKPAIHHRNKPSFVFDFDRVLRMYPVRLKTRGEILLEQFGIDDPDANEIYMNERAA